jgi:hypothetical protein
MFLRLLGPTLIYVPYRSVHCRADICIGMYGIKHIFVMLHDGMHLNYIRSKRL